MVITIRAVQRAVAVAYGVSVDDLLIDASHRAVRARHVAMFLARAVTGKGFSQIGRAFNRDHATVIYACRRMADEAQDDPSFAQRLEALSAAIVSGADPALLADRAEMVDAAIDGVLVSLKASLKAAAARKPAAMLHALAGILETLDG